MSVAMLQRGLASSTITSRPVPATLSRIVAMSSGDVVRGSITVDLMFSLASASAA